LYAHLLMALELACPCTVKKVLIKNLKACML
jgi:hypothetical protein